ncbi:unnamed protein product, partial [Ectocarpus sp. 12 AP-2014]
VVAAIKRQATSVASATAWTRTTTTKFSSAFTLLNWTRSSSSTTRTSRLRSDRIHAPVAPSSWPPKVDRLHLRTTPTFRKTLSEGRSG